MKIKKFLFSCLALFCAFQLSAELLVKSGEKVLFLGDSITQFGNNPYGYVRLVESALKTAGCTIEVIPAGVSGNKSTQMLSRFRRLIAQKPDWLLINCGVNDVAHSTKRVELPEYQKNMRDIFDMAQNAGIKVMVLTPTVIGEDLGNKNNQKLAGYIKFLREEAAARKLVLADTAKAFETALKSCTRKEKLKLTVDGLHMNGYGNQLMAATVLQAFGMDKEKLSAATAHWQQIPSMIPLYNRWHEPEYLISIPEYEALCSQAEKQNKACNPYILELIRAHAAKLMKKQPVSEQKSPSDMKNKGVKKMNDFSAVRERLDKRDTLRIVLFGASNTDRYMAGTHWGDVLHLGLRYTYFKPVWVINSGAVGNNTREALARFDRDVKSFSPDVVIITLGGNDCDTTPGKFVPEAEYRANLREIARRVEECGALPVFQTYYKMDIAAMEPDRAKGFLKNMDIVREEAAKNNWPLIDQYKLFDQLDENTFRYKYMLNAMHVNEQGNILIGFEVLRHFGLNIDRMRNPEPLLVVMKKHRELVEKMENEKNE